jgi:recombination associated protein RdgC
MWFRNLQIYRLLVPFELTPEELHQRLEGFAFKPCASLEPQTMGWTPPLGREGVMLTHAANGCMMICAKREERVLPSSVIKDELDEKVAIIEEAELRQVGRKEKQQIKDEIVIDLMPRAFTRSSLLYAYIDPRNGWVVLDSAAAGRAEDVLSLLRESLGSLKVRPLAVQEAPAAVMTRWLKEGAPDDFELQDECEMREPTEEGGIVRCRRQALDSDEVATHLEAGKQVVRLSVEWSERIGCVLSDDLVLRRLRFLDLIQEEAADASAEDAATRFDVDFALMSLELEKFIPRVVEIYGGLNDS